ncbi:MAG TPA: efflux RND transporter periplasmic adaptor subunit [Anaerolineales bacterium]|nr:efflux RND transporter periplasmic adaptor subunit [Anaerolineales bacterium]
MKKSLIVSRKIRWLLAGILVLVIVGGGAFYYTNSTKASSTATETPVQTATAFRGDIVLDANGTGTLAPAKEVSFGFGTSGQITELNVKIGDQVKAGQVLGKMDDSEVKAAYEQAKRNLDDLTTPAAIAAAKQAVAQAEVDIYNAKAALEHLISSDVYYWENQVATTQETLKTAQADGGTNPTADQKKKIDAATTALTRAQNNLQAAQLKYVNEYVPSTFTYTVTDETTGKTHEEVVAPSDADVAAARATYELAIETQKEKQAYLDMLNGKALPENVPGSSLTAVVEAQTALQTAEANLKATQLISPISGTVTDVTASVGDEVSASSIITIADLEQPYTIDTYLDAEDWSKVQAGYDAQIVFDILPDETFTGKVTVVYPALDTSSNSSLVHAVVKLNDVVGTNLPAGATAAVDVISGRAENAVLVPVEALHKAGPGKYAVFVSQNGKLRLREIEVGLQDLTYAEVKSGLEPGDIVTTGITETQ